MSDTAAPMKDLLGRVATGHPLSEAEAESAFDMIMSGNATPAQIGGFLMALRVRGETVAEITGAARAMRAKALTVQAPPGAVDTCGTGGDASGTYNVSTAAALVVASCGVPVAKHGNRALSSRSGSADVLKALGLNLEAESERVELCMREANIGFLMAPRHHSAMRHVAGPRVELGTRTVFNLLGPLSNPAGTRRQVVGVFGSQWVRPLAEVLGRLGCEHAWVVHGSDGLDELTVTGASDIAEYKDGAVRTFTIEPQDYGLGRWTPADLKGGDAEQNAAAIRRLLDGEPGAFRDIVLLNAGAALYCAGVADTLEEGVMVAQDAQASKLPLEKLKELAHFTSVFKQ